MFNWDEEFIQMLRLGTDSEIELNVMKEKKVEYRKQLGKNYFVKVDKTQRVKFVFIVVKNVVAFVIRILYLRFS